MNLPVVNDFISCVCSSGVSPPLISSISEIIASSVSASSAEVARPARIATISPGVTPEPVANGTI